MFWLLMILTMIISFFLVIAVLLQSPKGGGLAGTFGGAQIGAMFGSRRTADFLSKATWWLGGIIIVLAIVINLFFLPGKMKGSEKESIIQTKGVQKVPAQPVIPPSLPNQN